MRKLMLIALELIRFTAVVVNLRNTEWKRRWNQVTIWISFQTWSNLNSPMLWRTIVGDRITFFNFAWNQSVIHRLGGRANGDKFDQFVSPRIEIAEISTRRKISSLFLSLSLDSFQRDNFFHPSPFSYKGRASGVSIGGAEPISVQITDLQIRITVCEITNRFAATISNILRDGGEIGGEKRSHVRSRDRLCYFYL